LLANDLGAALDCLRRGDGRRAVAERASEDVTAALRQSSEALELLRFAASDELATLRRIVGLAAQ
jgi:hypothetical protein